jgi:hypothetical protein
VVLTADAENNYTISNVGNDVTITITSCKLGDIYQDNKIDSLDLVQLRKILAGILEPMDFEALAADMYPDGKVNSMDLVILRKYLAGLHEF